MIFRWRKEIKDPLSPKEIFDLLRSFRSLPEKDEDISEIDIASLGFADEIEILSQLIEKTAADKKKIIIYSDYDADGITGAAVFWETLHLMGFDVMPYIPDRKKEGYGFSKIGLDFIKKRYDPGLIISVDHGIAAADKVKYAKETLGIPVVITDHHLKPKQLPEAAEAIIHTDVLSGSGVAYFTAKAVFQKLKDRLEKSQRQRIKEFFGSDYLALATVGTVADLVPLVGISRSLVKQGLEVFPQVQRFGLQEIIREAGLHGRKITPYEIGFIIAPRINAVGRLQSAVDALRLLCTRDRLRAKKLADKLSQINRLRQNLVEKYVKSAIQQIERQHKNLPNILLAYDPEWEEGVIGLIASKLVEKFNRPAVVFTDSNGFLKASARSIPRFHITEFLRGFSDLLLEVGGHKQAAGLKLDKSLFAKLKKKMIDKAAEMISKKDLERIVETDLKLPIQALSLELAELVQKLEPFGIGNPRPSFYVQGEIISAQIFGKEKQFAKLRLRDEGTFFELISFKSNDLFFKLHRGDRIGVALHLDINHWNGKKFLRGLIIEWHKLD